MIHLKIEKVIDIPALAGLEIVGEFQPGLQVTMQPNSAASKWVDIYDLVMAQDLDIMSEKGELACDTFTKAIEEARIKEPSTGISWRWMLAAKDDDKSLELQLQALPCGEATIKAFPVLRRDNVPAIILAR